MLLFQPFSGKAIQELSYDLVRGKKITMLLSSDMENEFIRVLGYPKFGVSPKEILPFSNSLRSNAEFVKIHSDASVITVDPADNIFLECAVDGNADYIISGDKHLLDLKTYSDIQILKPKEFLVKEDFLKETEN